MASFTGPTLSYPRSVETTGYYLNFYTYDYNKAQSLGVKSIRDMLQETAGMFTGNGDSADALQNLSLEDQALLRTQEVEGGGTTGVTFDRSTDAPRNSSNGCVRLYIPPKLKYKYGANWNKTSFGAVGATMGAGVEGLVGAGAAAGLGKAFDTFIGSKLENLPGADGKIDASSVLGGAFGITFNDNTMQTFEKMNVREFSFDYMMAARNSSEERDIKQIIKFFKMAMHPSSRRSGANNSLFLEYPYIFRIIQSGKKDISQFLPQTKYCALTEVNVDYTPDNVLALTPNNFVQAVMLSLTFSEMTTMTRQDIHEIEDTATAEEWGWIEQQETLRDSQGNAIPDPPQREDFQRGWKGDNEYKFYLKEWKKQYGIN